MTWGWFVVAREMWVVESRVVVVPRMIWVWFIVAREMWVVESRVVVVVP